MKESNAVRLSKRLWPIVLGFAVGVCVCAIISSWSWASTTYKIVELVLFGIICLVSYVRDLKPILSP
jgi:hypothetical protein